MPGVPIFSIIASVTLTQPDRAQAYMNNRSMALAHSAQWISDRSLLIVFTAFWPPGGDFRFSEGDDEDTGEASEIKSSWTM